jgi:hypothetical protein
MHAFGFIACPALSGLVMRLLGCFRFGENFTKRFVVMRL